LYGAARETICAQVVCGYARNYLPQVGGAARETICAQGWCGDRARNYLPQVGVAARETRTMRLSRKAGRYDMAAARPRRPRMPAWGRRDRFPGGAPAHHRRGHGGLSTLDLNLLRVSTRWPRAM